MSESGNARNTHAVRSRAIQPPASSESLLPEEDEDVDLVEENENCLLDCDLTKIEYTSSEQLHNITANDSTVEVVGYTDTQIEFKYGPYRKPIFVTFYLKNDSDDRIQVVASSENEVYRCKEILKPNLILHIDGAYAQPCSVGNDNKGTIDFQLITHSATKLNPLGDHSITRYATEPILLKNIGSATTKYIKVQGFVKTNFEIIKNHPASGGTYFGCGSITDGNFKIEVHIPTMENTPHHLEKGDHVEVDGELQMNENPIYIRCISINDIKKIDDKKMPLKQLLQGCNYPISTEKENENYEKPQKKIRRK